MNSFGTFTLGTVLGAAALFGLAYFTDPDSKAFKERFPNKSLWSWSGFTFEDYVSKQEVINYLDVLVDGQYKDELRDPKLKYAGSSNQRAIDVKKSLKAGKAILFDDGEDD